MGNEQPYAHRVRAAVTGQWRWDRIGRPGVDAIELSEQRIDSTVVYAPHPIVMFSVVVPALFRQVSDVTLATISTAGLGDIEARAKLFVWNDGAFPTRHQLATTLGLKLPTARTLRRVDGTLLPVEVQTGTGSFDPSLAVNYSFTAYPYALFASVTAIAPTYGVERFRASPSLRASIAGQYTFAEGWVMRMALDTRGDLKAEENGAPSRDSGGFVAYLSPDLLWQPIQDLVVMVGVRLPFLQALDGYHREGVILSSTIAYDFN